MDHEDVNCGQRIHTVQVGMNICQQVSSRAGLKKTTKAWTPGCLLDVNVYKKEDHNQKEEKLNCSQKYSRSLISLSVNIHAYSV